MRPCPGLGESGKQQFRHRMFALGFTVHAGGQHGQGRPGCGLVLMGTSSNFGNMFSAAGAGLRAGPLAAAA
jgi:hypothetical protein